MATVITDSNNGIVTKGRRRSVVVRHKLVHSANGSNGSAGPSDRPFPEDPPGLGRNHPLYKTLGVLADDPEWEDYLEHIKQARQRHDIPEA